VGSVRVTQQLDNGLLGLWTVGFELLARDQASVRIVTEDIFMSRSGHDPNHGGVVPSGSASAAWMMSRVGARCRGHNRSNCGPPAKRQFIRRSGRTGAADTRGATAVWLHLNHDTKCPAAWAGVIESPANLPTNPFSYGPFACSK
jgi:hypothetical protein